MAKASTKEGVYAPPGLEPSATLRPEIIARIELLRIVWRPGMNPGKAMQDAAELEKFLTSGRAPEKSGDGG